MNVYLAEVWFYDGKECAGNDSRLNKLTLGVFSSKEKAQEAVSRDIHNRGGMTDDDEGLVSELELDKDFKGYLGLAQHWHYGYVYMDDVGIGSEWKWFD